MMKIRYSGRYWLAAYAVLFMLFLYLPVLLISVFAFNNSAVPAFPLVGFTTKWFDALAAAGPQGLASSLAAAAAPAEVRDGHPPLVVR